jgi:drug/metabolite transporter (DMT)-like permease
MAEVLENFLQLLLMRRGPQSLPASGLLLVLTVAGYLAVSCAASWFLPPAANWPALLLLDVAFLLAWNAVVLRLAGRAERILQTTTAVFGIQLLLAPPLVALDWLEQRYHGDPSWEGPLVFLGLALLVWLVMANSRIMSAALEWSLTASVALVVVQTVAEQWLQLAFTIPAKG